MPSSYLLDTSVLLQWTRDSPQAKVIDETYGLTASAMRPLVCEVSVGEMLAFSRGLRWGAERQRRIENLWTFTVVIDISDRGVMDAYAETSTLAKQYGWALFHAKNDLWVAAATRATGAHLLTMDQDFLPLRGRSGWSITVLDPKTALPVP